MNKYLSMVEEFHRTFGQDVNDHKEHINLVTRQLRIKLLFEELHELAQASGTEATFRNLCIEKVDTDTEPVEDSDIVDKVGELDALVDIEYVLQGAILSLGYQDMFDYSFTEVHRSNMSKMCLSMIEVGATMEHYGIMGQSSYYKEVGENKYIVYRTSDNKVLKNINYSIASLGVIHTFFTLMEIWKNETKYCSGPTTDHWAHEAIVEMGKSVLPLVFYHINEHLNDPTNAIAWAATLVEILGENIIEFPATSHGRGMVQNEIALVWGIHNGYCGLLEINEFQYHTNQELA